MITLVDFFPQDKKKILTRSPHGTIFNIKINLKKNSVFTGLNIHQNNIGKKIQNENFFLQKVHMLVQILLLE